MSNLQKPTMTFFCSLLIYTVLCAVCMAAPSMHGNDPAMTAWMAATKKFAEQDGKKAIPIRCEIGTSCVIPCLSQSVERVTDMGYDTTYVTSSDGAVSVSFIGRALWTKYDLEQPGVRDLSALSMTPRVTSDGGIFICRGGQQFKQNMSAVEHRTLAVDMMWDVLVMPSRVMCNDGMCRVQCIPDGMTLSRELGSLEVVDLLATNKYMRYLAGGEVSGTMDATMDSKGASFLPMTGSIYECRVSGMDFAPMFTNAIIVDMSDNDSVRVICIVGKKCKIGSITSKSFSYKWIKDGLRDSSNWLKRQQLQIKATASDAGVYRRMNIAANGTFTVEHPVELHVITQVTQVECYTGLNCTLRGISGLPWFRYVEGSERHPIVESRTATLCMERFGEDDVGLVYQSNHAYNVSMSEMRVSLQAVCYTANPCEVTCVDGGRLVDLMGDDQDKGVLTLGMNALPYNNTNMYCVKGDAVNVLRVHVVNGAKPNDLVVALSSITPTTSTIIRFTPPPLDGRGMPLITPKSPVILSSTTTRSPSITRAALNTVATAILVRETSSLQTITTSTKKVIEHVTDVAGRGLDGNVSATVEDASTDGGTSTTGDSTVAVSVVATIVVLVLLAFGSALMVKLHRANKFDGLWHSTVEDAIDPKELDVLQTDTSV